MEASGSHGYRIEADYMNEEERRELLLELLTIFRQHHTAAARDIAEQGERNQVESMAERAWQTLNSLFPQQPDLTHQFLSDETPEAESTILAQLEAWATNGLTHRPGGAEVLRWEDNFEDRERCKDALDSLAYDPNDRSRPAAWPFVTVVRYV